jgi:Family of unknown function (DUF6644)
MLVNLAIWVQNLNFFADIRSSGYTYPVLLALHLVGIGLFAGMILATDIRILGWGMRGYAIADVIKQTRWFKRIGLLFTATCGFLLFCSKAEAYYYNTFFRIKLILFALVLIHALIYRGSVYNQPDAIEGNPSLLSRARIAAGLSLTLWTCIMIAGRGIGYLNAPAGMHFSMLLAPFRNVL